MGRGVTMRGEPLSLLKSWLPGRNGSAIAGVGATLRTDGDCVQVPANLQPGLYRILNADHDSTN